MFRLLLIFTTTALIVGCGGRNVKDGFVKNEDSERESEVLNSCHVNMGLGIGKEHKLSHNACFVVRGLRSKFEKSCLKIDGSYREMGKPKEHYSMFPFPPCGLALTFNGCLLNDKRMMASLGKAFPKRLPPNEAPESKDEYKIRCPEGLFKIGEMLEY